MVLPIKYLHLKKRNSFKNSYSRWSLKLERNNASSISPLKVTNKYVNMDKIEQIARMCHQTNKLGAS
jgi:hypothetical protein